MRSWVKPIVDLRDAQLGESAVFAAILVHNMSLWSSKDIKRSHGAHGDSKYCRR